MTAARARVRFAELASRVAYGGERFVVTRHGREAVAIVPVHHLALLDRLRAALALGDCKGALELLRSAEEVAGPPSEGTAERRAAPNHIRLR